jgi:nucleotide-binding universal stress UspA family protein
MGEAVRTFRIVAGVDGSEGGRHALRWAVREAAAKGGTVQAVIAYRFDAPTIADEGLDAERRRAEALLAHEVEALPAYQRTGVSIACEALEGMAAEVLTTAAREADLLVVGSNGHSGVWHTAVGSISEGCIRQSTCPVVVIPSGDVD